MPLREELFTQGIACPMGASLEDQAILDRWQCLRDYCFADQAREEKWQLILKLAARRPLEKCNKFIYSLTTINEDASFGINIAEFNAQKYSKYNHALDDAQNAEFNALIEAYPWLNEDCYSDQASRHILYHLNKDFFNENKESGADRLQFYHNHHRLAGLIKLIKEGKLDVKEAATYDKFEFDKIPPRMLPRLLAGDLDAGTKLTQAEIVAYDLHDYDPKNNPHRHKMLTEDDYYSETRRDYEKYKATHTRGDNDLATYFNTVLKPVVAERARLYLDLQELKKQKEAYDEKSLTNFQWLYYCFYKTPPQECELVSAKIALFSGALEDMQNFLRNSENVMNNERKSGCDSTFTCDMDYIFSFLHINKNKYPNLAMLLEPVNSINYYFNIGDGVAETYTGKKSLFSSEKCFRYENNKYLDETLGNNTIVDSRIVTGEQFYDEKENRQKRSQKPLVINEARNYVASFFKSLAGSILTLATVGTALLSSNFRHTFFGTQSFNCLDKAKESGTALAKKIDKDERAADRLEHPERANCCSWIFR